MKNLNSIPNSRIPLAALAAEAVSAALTLRTTLNLLHNPAELIAADYHTLVGDPDAPATTPNIGKQGELNEAIAQRAEARRALKSTVQTGREFAAAALRLLKNSLGATLNSRWRDAGFTLKSLRIVHDPTNLLLELRTFFRLQRAKESAEQNLTAVRADALLTELQDRRQAVGEKRTAEMVARQARNAAQTALRRRLSNLRNELAQLLSKDDARWYEFGFKRPIDGRMPGMVTGLDLQPGLPGEVRTKWDSAPRALNYRVKWRPDVAAATATEVGLFAQREAILRDLPSGASIVVSVSARNASGESTPIELTMKVP